MTAACEGHTQMIKLLLDRGAEIDAHDNDDWSALHYAAHKDQLPAIKLLLAEGARIDVSKSGTTPAVWARKRGHLEAALLLENHSVTVNLSGVIARGLTDGLEFSDFLVKGICDARLFIIVSQFAFQE